jgi:hypothetical protein
MEQEMNKVVCGLVIAALGSLATASALAGELRPVALFGVSYRGDELQVAASADGSPVTINGVGKLNFGFGGEWAVEQYPLSVRLVLSRDVDKSARTNGGRRDSFARTPLEATAFYSGLDGLRFGVSLGYVFSPTAKATVDGRERRMRFENAVSKSFEIAYRLSPDLWASLRLSSATYKPTGAAKTAGAVKNDVTHLSVGLAYVF